MSSQRILQLLATVAFATACGDDAPPPPPPPTPIAHNASEATPAPTPHSRADAGVIPQMPITDGTFVEGPSVRDPFRNYASEFLNTGVRGVVDTRDVRLSNYSLEDLRLVAVIVGTDNPYAMVTDPSRAGTILRRGNYVGRQEVIHSNVEGRSDYAVHWRVARIIGARYRRLADSSMQEIPAELVFERPDPLNPTAPPVERVVSLAPVGQQATGLPVQVPAGVSSGTSFLPPAMGSTPNGPTLLPGTPPAGAPGTDHTVTYITPPTPPPPTTVLVQAPPAQPPLVVPPSTTPPPVQVNSGPSGGPGSLPLHGLN